MKMSYRLRDRNAERRSYRFKAILFAVVSLMLVGVLLLLPGTTTRLAHLAAAPFWKGGSAVSDGAETVVGYARSKSSLIEENERLRGMLDEARMELMGEQALRTENDELRTLLSIPRDREFTFAAVLAKPPVSPYDSLVIEAGSDSGIEAGAPVYTSENVILGVITEVHDKTSVVSLYSTAGTLVDVVIERSGASHTAAGAGAGNFELKVPKDLDVIVGDMLLLPGMHTKILGIVRQIESRQTDSFQKVYVKTPVNIFQLRWVAVEKI